MIQQAGQRRAARAVLLLLTVLALAGMHGLPDAMASPSGATTVHASGMPASPSMSIPSATPWTTDGVPTQYAHAVGTLVGLAAQLTAHDARSSQLGPTPPMGCGMDHANCVAVLRDPGHLTAAGAAPTVVAVLAMPSPPSISTPARGPRPPPCVSLIGLGISRT